MVLVAGRAATKPHCADHACQPGILVPQGVVAMAGFEMDAHPVTNAQYASFLGASGYEPADPINFLRHWSMRDGGRSGAVTLQPPPPRPPAGTEAQPVTWVGFEDAQRFCGFYGWRLPNEWEWNYAAQGPSARPNRASVCAARTLNATGQSRATLSPR